MGHQLNNEAAVLWRQVLGHHVGHTVATPQACRHLLQGFQPPG